jgi:hypothetical protein
MRLLDRQGLKEKGINYSAGKTAAENLKVQR